MMTQKLPHPPAADSGAPRAQMGRIAGAFVGIAAAYAITRQLPFLPATLLSSLVLAATSTCIGRIHSPLRWWALLGTACGSGLLGCLALAGGVAGHNLSRDAAGACARHPRDLLRSASALTTGLFAVLVTVTFLHSGLETARTFSSRLITSLTILVATLAVPGWLTHLLHRPPPRGPRQRS